MSMDNLDLFDFAPPAVAFNRPLFGKVSPWDQERVDLLTQLWAEGLRGSIIADRLGITRNAVLGKVHRLGLPGRPRPPSKAPHDVYKRALRQRKRMASPAQERIPRPARPKRMPMLATRERTAPRVRQLVTEWQGTHRLERKFVLVRPLPGWEGGQSEHALPFLDRERHQCAWPLWTDETPITERMVCGAPVLGKDSDNPCSWCAHHFDIVTRPDGR